MLIVCYLGVLGWVVRRKAMTVTSLCQWEGF